MSIERSVYSLPDITIIFCSSFSRKKAGLKHEEVWRSNVLEGPVCERDARVEHNIEWERSV